ncbi:MAG: hypothetical protein L6R36_005084 [Xanthoria steineri]|nr:MAG: hypothetical protein L6R36_005084 [Xanthoria steineri]
MPQAQPELKKYLDKRLFVQLNGSRKVLGVLRGYDVFLNVVLDDAVEEKAGGEKVRLGMVVRALHFLTEYEGSSITILIGVIAGHPRELSSDVGGM